MRGGGEEGARKGCGDGGGGGARGGDENGGVLIGVGQRRAAKGEGGTGGFVYQLLAFHVAAAVVLHFHQTLLLIYHPFYHLNLIVQTLTDKRIPTQTPSSP